MPKFIAIGYGDRAGYDQTTLAVRTAAHAYDDTLKQGGAVIGIAGDPVQVRNPDDTGMQTINTAFMSASLPIAAATRQPNKQRLAPLGHQLE
jgi:hypothetical protein